MKNLYNFIKIMSYLSIMVLSLTLHWMMTNDLKWENQSDTETFNNNIIRNSTKRHSNHSRSGLLV